MKIPRPLGLTRQSLNYQRTRDKLPLHQALILSYVQNNYMINDIYMSPVDFSITYNIDQGLLQSTMQRYLTDAIPYGEKGSFEGIIRELFSRVFSWSLEDKGLAAQQVRLLSHSQGAGYKAWVSAEYTKALKLSQDATKGMLTLMQAVVPQQLQISTLQGTQNTAEEGTLTTEKALELLTEFKALNSGPNAPRIAQGPTSYSSQRHTTIKHEGPINNDEIKEGLAEGLDSNGRGVSEGLGKDVGLEIGSRSKKVVEDARAKELFELHGLGNTPEVSGRNNDTENINPMLRMKEIDDGPKTTSEHKDKALERREKRRKVRD